jgi:hypothetical protein
MKTTVRLTDVIKTLHADLIGKDSHRGITLTYGWMANQIGHFALGFIPTVLLVNCGHLPLNALLYVSLFWLIFEIYNALSPLYKKEYKGNGTFKPHWSNLTFDTFTDLCFFWLGSASYYFIIEGINAFFVYYCIGLFFILLFTRFWFLTKLYQQNAFFPYQFRLSQWDGEIRPIDTETIKGFLANGDFSHHFLVFGGKGSGKTRLSVGIANEMSIRHRKSYYTTFSKFCNLINMSDLELQKSKFSLWNWNESDLMVVDDINPGEPVAANKYSPGDLVDFIKNEHTTRNMAVLTKMNVIWVIGTSPANADHLEWKNALLTLGIRSEQITFIDLNLSE